MTVGITVTVHKTFGCYFFGIRTGRSLRQSWAPAFAGVTEGGTGISVRKPIGAHGYGVGLSGKREAMAVRENAPLWASAGSPPGGRAGAGFSSENR